LWSRVPEPSGFRAFFNCINFSSFKKYLNLWYL
jgi:hypothetical protein